MNTAKKPKPGKLLRAVEAHYKVAGRGHLPWRETRDAYRILVSEVMLQQTQVARVVPFYRAWVKKYPSARALARAPLSEVLTMWSGLGYNRRAKYLWEAAKIISKEGWQEKLPGVGPYTKAAVETFAYNKPNIFIETNIRTVFLYFCFAQKRSKVSDKELEPLIAEALKHTKLSPRQFMWALMDYGSFLKQSGVRLNRYSAHYTKQSKFKGSPRELRGAVVRELLHKPATLIQLKQKLPRAVAVGELQILLAQLVREGMVRRLGPRYRVGR